MFCPQCHQKIEPFSTICPHCGHKSIISVREEQETQLPPPPVPKINPFGHACRKILLAAGGLLLLVFLSTCLICHK